MDKKEALKIILNCAKIYKQNLENKNLLIVLETKNKQIKYFETIFLPRNYLHLTGIKIINKKIKSSIDFYNLCLKNKLKISDFEFNSNGTTPLKLQILPQIVNIQKVSKMVGNYNNIKPYLYTKKIIGNINVCLGFIKQNKYYIPNTVLKEDIRNITQEQAKVIAIMIKCTKEKAYKNITYLSKNVNINEIIKNVM